MADSSDMPIRIALLTPYLLTRPGLKRSIEDCSDLKVVTSGAASQESLETIATLQPDIILLELLPGKLPGLEIVSELLKACDHTRIILITQKCEQNYYLQAIQEGIIGVVFKDQPLELLIKAIRKVHAGEAWIDRSTVATLLVNLSGSQPVAELNPESKRYTRLNSREREIVQLIGKGFKTKQVAERLFISETTVRHYLTSIYDKLEVSDRLELFVLAHRLGLADLS